MKNLNILSDGMTIEPIEIIAESASLQINTTGTLSFYFSHDRKNWDAWPETVECNGNHWEPMDHLKRSVWLKIVSTGTINSASWQWNLPIKTEAPGMGWH